MKPVMPAPNQGRHEMKPVMPVASDQGHNQMKPVMPVAPDHGRNQMKPVMPVAPDHGRNQMKPVMPAPNQGRHEMKPVMPVAPNRPPNILGRCGAGLRPAHRCEAGLRAAVAVLSLAVSVPFSSHAQNTKSGPCDRACLESFADQYMDALIAHDPKLLPLSAKLKNTENGQRLEPGDGFWRTATAKGKYRLFVDDPQSGQVALMTTMTEASGPQAVQVPIAIRLKIDNRQIAEIETFVVRTGLSGGTGAAELEKLGSPNPLFLQTIPSAERASREDLIKTANLYFSALEKNDGKGNYSFFADDCERLEDGRQTTHNPNFRTGAGFTAAPGGRGGRGEKQAEPAPAAGFNPATLGCKEQFQSGYFRFVTRIRDRRFVAVDTERGLVFSFVFFDHAAGKYREYAMADGTGASNGPTRPWTWELAEVFKIEHGKIRRVEALLDQVPYGMLSGWSTWEEGMSPKPR